MKLVIVESPTKARTLSRFLGGEYQILASMGHVRDLPRSKLSVDEKHDFKPVYAVVEGKEKAISELKKAAKKANEIILATDLDREGEAIAWHVAWLLKEEKKSAKKKSQLTISRITFHEITKEAIEAALKKPGEVNIKLVHAQQARRVLDRLAGYKLSPLLWRKIRRGLSAGRVQSPAVRLIVEKEREIKAFKPDEYWLINAELKGKAKEHFLAELIRFEEKKSEIKNKLQSDNIIKDLKKSDYYVAAVTKKEIKRSPPPPFITSTLQRAGASLFHWSAKKTMREAQQLYEKGFITYHRTDSVNLAQGAVKQAREYINTTFGKEFLPEQPRFYKSKSKLAQEAHEAIRPTKMRRNIKFKQKHASRLYQLIFNRFIACQMEAQILEKDIVDIKAGKYMFRAIGQREKFAGWKKVHDSIEKEAFLPQLSEGEKLQLIKVHSEQKFTQPPARYNEGSLIKALEERGIGRPSTYASIISTIQGRQYVEKIEGSFCPTPVGEIVNDFLVKHFNNIVDYDFTAEMEDDLDKIAHGERKWVDVVSEFYTPFAKKLEKVSKEAERVKIPVEKIGKKCPKCKKGEQVIRVGRFGKFLSCSKFPDCIWKAVYIEKVKGFKCPECKSDVLVRRTRKGKTFYGCSKWPKCKWASWRKPKVLGS